MVMRYTNAPTQRQLKTAQGIRAALAEVFVRGELSHPFFESLIITVSEVRISADLKNATAFLILPTDAPKKEIMKLLNENVAAFRKIITPKLQMKYSPHLRFVPDDTADNAKKIDDLLHKN